jgi:hypothetical protein
MKKAISCLILLAVVCLVATPMFADPPADPPPSVLRTQSGIYDGWEGRSFFSAAPGNPDLNGYVDWAVYEADAFPFLDTTPGPAPFTTFSRTAGELTYAYQVFSTGTDQVSYNIVFLDSYADHIGAVTDLSKGLSGDTPIVMQLDAPGGQAVWGFNGILQNQNSEGLVYCSPYAPVMADASIILDGGTYAVATIQVPSALPIPEPATLWMLIAATCVFAARYFRRP